MRKWLCVALLTVVPAIASAQDAGSFDLGGDHYEAGQTVVLTAPVEADAFLAGQTVTASAPVAGALHAAGQTVRVEREVGGNLYAAGQSVDVTSLVSGNLTAFGQTVSVAETRKNLRAWGQEVTIFGTVEGSALVAGSVVAIDGDIQGDLSLAAERVTFGPEARVAGTLTLYHEDPDTMEIPASVAPPERIVRRTIEEWEAEGPGAVEFGTGLLLRGFLGTFVTVTLLAALMAAVMPRRLADLRARLIARPFHALWLGFLAMSVLIGAVVVLAMTVIGLLGLPLAIPLAIVASLLGFVVSAYALGVWLLTLAGRGIPTRWVERLLGAVAGAAVIALVGLIPFIGWLVTLTLTLAGLGALTASFFRPAFFAES